MKFAVDSKPRIEELEKERDLLGFLARVERDPVIAALQSELVFSLDRRMAALAHEVAPPARWPRSPLARVRGAGRSEAH